MALDSSSLFRRNETLVSIDIGSSSLKLVEVSIAGDKPKLVNLAVLPFDQSDIFNNNSISKSEQVAEGLLTLLEANSISDRRAVTAMPGPSAFTKKIVVPKMDISELGSHIQLRRVIRSPYSIDAVKLDYHIIRETSKGLEVLVVAVKNEVVDSFLETLMLAGLDTAVVDVDYFAMQNAFEMAYPDQISKTVALINMGARYSSINICRGGDSLFTGDIAVGGKLFTEALMNELGLDLAKAEQAKRGGGHPGVDDIIDRNLEYIASEFNRQLSFFWNASGADEGIDRIMLAGGGSLANGG